MMRLMLIIGLLISSYTYGKWDSNYHTQSSSQFERGKKAIDSLNLQGDENILDVGCGTGRTTNYCASQLTTGHVHGTDFSQDMIDFAKETYKNIDHISFEYLNVLDLNIDSEFDIVYSFFCLHWIAEQEHAIKNIVRSLKPGGKALLYVNCESDLMQRYYKASAEVLNDNPELQQNSSKFIFLNPTETWIQWITNAGGSTINYEFVDSTRIFTTPQALKAFLLSLNIEPRMSTEQRELFLDLLIIKLYESYNLATTEPFDYTMKAIILQFNK